jgi:hypothetical protein
MYTAKVISKEYVGAALRLTVEFTNGVKTVSETCIPQNEEGLNSWIKSRLETFNSGSEIDTKLKVNDAVDGVPDVIVPDPLPQEVIDRNTWFEKVNRLSRIKTHLIDNGVIVGAEKEYIDLVNDVKATYLPEYLNFV